MNPCNRLNSTGRMPQVPIWGPGRVRIYLSATCGAFAYFGGSFDPPHCGHIAVALAARAALALDTVLFAPVGAQPLKPSGPSASFEHRLAMTRLAIAGERALLSRWPMSHALRLPQLHGRSTGAPARGAA